MCDEPMMSGEEIESLVQERLCVYEGLSLFEKYAMFMGKAQLLEFGLKGVLERKYGLSPDSMEKWTLGRTKNELSNRGLRPDFISLLQSLVDHRNSMAHEYLANLAVTRSLGDFSPRAELGELFRASYEVEQLIILFDWCEEHNGWDGASDNGEA